MPSVCVIMGSQDGFWYMMAIPKMPSVETNGRCEHWLQAMREWAMMAPMGIALGLVPPDPVEAGRVPRRLRLDDVIVDGELRHRLRRTKWDSPFSPGHDCAFDD